MQEVRNLPATEIEAKMTGSSTNADITKPDQVRVHFFLTTRAAIVEEQDIGVMSVPPLAQVGTLFLPLNSEKDRPTTLRRQRPRPWQQTQMR